MDLRLPDGTLRSDYLDHCPVRWVITYFNVTHGLRMLAEPAQGRYTYDTENAAQARLDVMRPGEARAFGTRLADSLELRAVPCWPGHHDPTRTVFEADAGVMFEP